MDFALTDQQQSIRDAIAKICARFDDAYWLAKDRDGGYAVQDIFESAPFLAEAIFDRYLEIGDEQFVGVHRLAAHLMNRMHGDAAAVEVRIEQAETMGRRRRLLKRRDLPKSYCAHRAVKNRGRKPNEPSQGRA